VLPRTLWNSESLTRPLIAAFGLVGALVALWMQIPQTEIKAFNAQKQLAEAEKKLLVIQEQHKKAEDEHNGVSQAWRQEVQTLENQVRALQQETTRVVGSESTHPAITNATAVSPLKSRVYVQFAGNISRTTIDQFRTRLADEGFIVPGAERIDRGQ
jgi:hypothetical protein